MTVPSQMFPNYVSFFKSTRESFFLITHFLTIVAFSHNYRSPVLLCLRPQSGLNDLVSTRSNVKATFNHWGNQEKCTAKVQRGMPNESGRVTTRKYRQWDC